jgi:hypothetical protein
MEDQGVEVTLEEEEGGCSSSHANNGGRGENQNNSQPSGQRFDKSSLCI